MNNAPNISGFKLVECLHMKFSKTEEADRLQIERKRLTKTLLGLVFACIMIRNEYKCNWKKCF